MWARNLLFVGVCLAGILALAGALAPQPPPVLQHDAGSVTQPDFQDSLARLDGAFAAAWEASGLEPAPRADDLAIARRLSLALCGTVPSVEELRQFEAQPPGGRIAWWLAGLFEDRRSSDYLAERWARAFVGTEDGPFLIYRRRRFVAWLADQLHANRPYDQIVAELIAQDGLWTDRPATNFITVTVQPDQGEGPDENRLAARVSRAFLGVRLDCAECHDHPFRAWKQNDFRSLAAFFGNAENSLRGIRDGAGPPQVADPMSGERRSVEPAVPFEPRLIAENGTARQRLAGWVTHRENRAFARATANRAWALVFGRPLVEPVDDIATDDEVPAALAALAEDFAAHGYDLRRLLSLVALSAPFQLDSRAAQDDPAESDAAGREAAWAQFPLTRLRPEQVVGSVQQAASLATLDYQSHVVLRIVRQIGQAEFVKRYGDSGEDELAPLGGTIPQRLLLMNGDLVKERTEDGLLTNAATQLAVLAPSDGRAVEVAYLACLTRRPTPDEAAHFQQKLAAALGPSRRERMEDLYWALVNSTEFSWNH